MCFKSICVKTLELRQMLKLWNLIDLWGNQDIHPNELTKLPVCTKFQVFSSIKPLSYGKGESYSYVVPNDVKRTNRWTDRMAKTIMPRATDMGA